MEWRILCNDETGKAPIMWTKNTPEDRKFWEVYMTYWRDLKLDNMIMWTDEQIQYLRDNTFWAKLDY